MDPDQQLQDPINENDMGDMSMDPEGQMNPPDDLQMNPSDNDQNENNNVQRSINIPEEANDSMQHEEQSLDDDGDENIQIEDNEEDDFITDDNEEIPKNEEVKALSEKQEDQGNLEQATNNIAMSLLPQSANLSESIAEKNGENINESQTPVMDQSPNENEDIIINENQKENEKAEEAESNSTQKDGEQEIPNSDQENQNLQETIENENEGNPEGMEVQDDMTPQRITRQRKILTPIESLSKLPPLQTDPDLDAENLRLLTNFQKKGRLPDITQRAQLVQYIQREKINSVVAQRFGRAQELQNLLQKYQKAIVDQEIKERNREKLENLKTALETTKEELKKSDKDLKYKIEDEKEKQKDHYYNLLQRQDEELNIFERKWNDPNYIQKYAKPSSVLLTMKNIERSMVLTKMFEQAEDIHNKVKELEKSESKQAQEVAENEMEKEKQKILTKQALEVQTFEQNCSRQIEIIERNHESVRSKTKAKIAKLEAEIQELEKNPPTALPPMNSPCMEFKAQSVMTPRTIKRYSIYKTQSKKPVLTLNPLKNVRPSKKSRSKTRSSLS